MYSDNAIHPRTLSLAFSAPMSYNSEATRDIFSNGL
jgi:hypothetical protein